MALGIYHIFVDGQGYAGESDEVEDQPAGPGGGWSGVRPRQCAGIKFGEPMDVVCRTNLVSAMDRILRRIGDSKEIIIRRVGER